MKKLTTIITLAIAAILIISFYLIPREVSTSELPMPDSAEGCTGCHGVNSMGVANLSLKMSGMPSKYFKDQIHAYQTGMRKSGIMEPIARKIKNESDLNEIALYYESLEVEKITYEKIILTENLATIVKNCASCHGNEGLGSDTAPRLEGQYEYYIKSQLKKFKNSVRKTGLVMIPIAQKLTDKEIEVLAKYYAPAK